MGQDAGPRTWQAAERVCRPFAAASRRNRSATGTGNRQGNPYGKPARGHGGRRLLYVLWRAGRRTQGGNDSVLAHDDELDPARTYWCRGRHPSLERAIDADGIQNRSEEHTLALQSLKRIPYAVFG